MKMKNIGNTDRIVRYVLGVGLIAAGVILQITTGTFWWLALIGAVPVITASIQTCPLYLPFKINTIKSR
jgi:hypothetical protein